MTSRPHKPRAAILNNIIIIETCVVKHIINMAIPAKNPAAINPFYLPFNIYN
jgi:hypothetical protein